MASTICSRFRVTPAVPRSNVEYDGPSADTVALSGVASERGDGRDSVSVPRNALRRGFVRILSGISSKIEANVRRWLIRLH